MARGPLPKKDARRANAPTIPTTNLPAGGRQGSRPTVPRAYKLGAAGKAWWTWAWKLPQAAAWDAGALYAIARRAQLEDDLAALEDIDLVDLADMFGVDEESTKSLAFAIGRLKAMAGGRATVMREMRELDNRLGLNPKALADLRWTIVDTEKPAAAGEQQQPANVRRLRAVDPAAAAG
jgi:hypothetical protein